MPFSTREPAGPRKCGPLNATESWHVTYFEARFRSLAVWGTAAEIPLAEKIVECSEGHAVLAPQTSMLELGALCRRAAMFVGSDTGPMHLAVAVGTPTISMHGPTRADWCGAYGPRNLRMQIRYEAGSSLERRRADDSAMRSITVGMVAHACDQLLRLHVAA